MTTELFNQVFNDVREFARVGESPLFRDTPMHTVGLCERLVDEEVNKEFLPALRKFQKNQTLENLAEAADGAIDGIYVLAFFLTQMELPAEQMWKLVQENNMSKFPNGVAMRDAGGKIQKPPGFKPVDLMPLLIDWWSKQRGESYKGGLIQHEQ